MILLRLCRNILLRLLVALVIISSLVVPPAFCQETEDSQVFIAGFNSYQQKDYASSIEKMSEVLQKYPDTPLRDMALFWLSRSYFKVGNQQEAARYLSQFSKEYPDNPLKSTVEDELLSLVARYEKGEKLPVGSPPQKQSDLTAANKAKADKELIAAAKAKEAKKAASAAELARAAAIKQAEENAAADKKEQERVAAAKVEAERKAEEAKLAAAEREKAEQQRIAAIKSEENRKAAELKEQERIKTAEAEEARVAAAKAEEAKIAAAKAEEAKIAVAKAEEAKVAAAAKAEQERIAQEKAAFEKAEQQRIASIKSEELRKAAQQVEQDRIAAAKAEEAKLAAAKAELERVAAVKAEEAKRIEAANAEAARLAAIRQAEEKAAAEKKELERVAAVKAEQDRLALETAALEKAEQQKIAAIKSEEVRKAAELAEQQRIAEDKKLAAVAKAEQEQLAVRKAEEALRGEAAAESVRIAEQKTETVRLAQTKAEQERALQAGAELDRMNALKEENERKAMAEKAERERIALAKSEEAKQAAAAAEAARMASIKAEEESRAAERVAKEAEKSRMSALKSEEARLAEQKLAEEKAHAAKLAYREKAIGQYKTIIDKFPASTAAVTAAAKLRELGIAVALPPKSAELPMPENSQVLRLEVAQFAGFELNLLARPDSFAVGRPVTLPFEVINRGNGKDSFSLESAFPADFKARFVSAAAPGTAINQTPELAPNEAFKGLIELVIPPASIDGLRIMHPVKAASRLMAEASQSREVRLVASAPLLRAVLRTEKTRILPGEKAVYRIAILNVGSTAAQDVTLHLNFPAQLEPVDYAASGFRQEMKSALVLDGLKVNSGESRELSVAFQLKDDSLAGQELTTRADLINNQLKTTAAFVSNMAYVESQRSILVRTGSDRLVAIPGQTLTVPFVVTNAGNIREKFKISSVVTGIQNAIVFNDLNRDGIRQSSEPVINEIGPLAPREEASVVVEVKAPNSAVDNSQGSVQLTFLSEGDATRSATGLTQLTYSRPVLKMIMAGRDERPKPGDVASFDLTISNNGSNLARVVELQSAWPDQLELIAAVPDTTSVVNGNVIWRFKELGAGEKRSIKVSFRVKTGTGVGTALQVKNVLTYEDQLGNRY